MVIFAPYRIVDAGGFAARIFRTSFDAWGIATRSPRETGFTIPHCRQKWPSAAGIGD